MLALKGPLLAENQGESQLQWGSCANPPPRLCVSLPNEEGYGIQCRRQEAGEVRDPALSSADSMEPLSGSLSV